MSAFIGRRALIPYLRPFPIWRFGPLYVGKGWYADWYGDREAKHPDPVRVGARVRVAATGRTGLVLVDFGDGSYSVKLDDGWGSDIVARDGLTMSKDES